jgi:hypothetical protein
MHTNNDLCNSKREITDSNQGDTGQIIKITKQAIYRYSWKNKEINKGLK